jgi:hypothetical protein
MSLGKLLIFVDFFSILPIIIYTSRIKNISSEYSNLFYILLAGLISGCFSLFDMSAFHIGIIRLVYIFIEIQFFLIIFIKWIDTTHRIKLKYLHFLFFSFWLIDVYIKFKINNSSVDVMYLAQLLILTFIGLKFIATKSKVKVSQVLTMLPLIIYSIYFIIVNLLMHWLYNKETKDLFMNLYGIINLINFLSYISYSLAILWAPKKEKYL